MKPINTDLFVRYWGEQGEPVLLLHGTTLADGEVTWYDQRSLSDNYRLIVPDRRGYGTSPGPTSTDWEDHIADAISLIGDGVHLVGHSYGGVIAMLVATRRPELVRSLTVIEPPAFGLAYGRPAVDALVAHLKPIFDPASGLTEEQFTMAFTGVIGAPPPDVTSISSQMRAQIRAQMTEPVPWSAPIDLNRIAAAPFPKLVLSGNWHPAFDAVCDVLTDWLPARRLVLTGRGHGAHHVDNGAPFNAALIELFTSTHLSSSTIL